MKVKEDSRLGLSGWRPHPVLYLLLCLSNFAVEGMEQTFLHNVRQLTFQGKAGEGYFSANGEKLIFQSEREPGNPFYQIYILNFRNGDLQRVSPGIGKTTCGYFRPGTEEVLFASTHHDPAAVEKQKAELDFRLSGKTRRYSWDYDEQMEIWTAQEDGSGLKRLTHTMGYDAEGAYSPDGTKIVFTSIRDAFPLEGLSPELRNKYETDPAWFGEIYIMNADGTEQRRLTQMPGYDGGPFFTADGKRIVWRRFEEKGGIADIYSMNLDGTDVRQITRFESMAWAPFPHPSGEYLVFTSNKHGFENFELFIVDMEGNQNPVRVTFTDGFDGLPVFSPDGRKLCWTSNRGSDRQSQLFLADWNHPAALAVLKSAENSRSVTVRELSPNIRAEDAKAHVEVLASDEMEGRETGTAGARKAAAYLAEQFESVGLVPLTTNGYLLPFEFTAGVKVNSEGTALIIQGGSEPEQRFELERDFRPLSFSANGTHEGGVVFAGYGLHVPGRLGEGYDSFSGVNLSNKLVLMLRYVPEGVEPARRQELNRYAALRYKAMLARERGAKGVLVVSGPKSPNAGQLIPLSSDGSLAGSDILAASISDKVAEVLVRAAGKTLKEVQESLDLENPHAEKAFELPGMKVTLSVALAKETVTDFNVVGALPGVSELTQTIIVGAHYDHLGYGEAASSREHGEESGNIHNGADDNASGVAVVLELAAYFREMQKSGANFSRGMVFALWSGEEKGLLGSSRYVENSPIPLTNTVAYLNFDMVGRLRENKLTLQGAGSSPFWRRSIERRNVAAGFNLVVQDDPYLPTDTTAFYPKGVPTLSFFTGSHEDYHRPTDDPHKVNYEGIQKIAEFASLMLVDLLKEETRPEYVKIEKSSMGGNRDGLRAYLGTIPDYSTDIQGVKISGVRAGSPAERAGLKSNDVILEFGGQKISNIYEYTYALDAAKIGQPVRVKVEREGKQITVEVTPEARK